MGKKRKRVILDDGKHTKAFSSFIDLISYCSKHRNRECKKCIFSKYGKQVVRFCYVEDMIKHPKKEIVEKVRIRLEKYVVNPKG